MENLAKIKQRVIFFVESQGIKKEDFYKKISSNGGNFRGKSLQSELSGEKIAEILANYTNLNPEWLILGKGEMLKDANAIPKCSEPPIHYNVEVDYKNKYLEVLEELTTLSRETIRLQSKIISLQEGLILNNKKRQNNHDAVHEM